MLVLYREALRIRRTEAGFGDGPLNWLPSAPDVLAFVRTGGLICVVNLAGEPVELPGHTERPARRAAHWTTTGDSRRTRRRGCGPDPRPEPPARPSALRRSEGRPILTDVRLRPPRPFPPLHGAGLGGRGPL